jgi:hypothetical protein
MAIVQLGGGTASFVSPEGLLLTNHHVAFTALQWTSSVNSDYLTNGFLAMNQSGEIKAPGYTARMVLDIKDVTKEILDAVKDVSDPLERDQKVELKSTEMTQAIEEGKEDIRAIVSENFNGKQYILYTYKVFRDIRIVYAPPMAIGNYGGEIDNWMWLRHTGDFSFMRVYVAPDGTGREYSPDNVPYKPAVWLKVAQTDLDEGDFTFVVGFPGFTTRYRTSTSAAWNLEQNYPFTIRNFKEIIEMADFITRDDPEGQIKVANLTKGPGQYTEKFAGKSRRDEKDTLRGEDDRF